MGRWRLGKGTPWTWGLESVLMTVGAALGRCFFIRKQSALKRGRGCSLDPSRDGSPYSQNSQLLWAKLMTSGRPAAALGPQGRENRPGPGDSLSSQARTISSPHGWIQKPT